MKINAGVVRRWTEILRRVPTARLLLQTLGFEQPAVRQRLADMFQAEGIDPARIEMSPYTPLAEVLAAYQRVDIALDPFPFSGSLTTCDALWMGVPVVTCPGETFASRHALSHLSNVGLTETIARDGQEYVELAVRLAHDLPRLAELRATLRQRVAASPLCDGRRFAANLMTLLRGAWRQWCVGNAEC